MISISLSWTTQRHRFKHHTSFLTFLAHLNWKLMDKWTFVIYHWSVYQICHPSVRQFCTFSSSTPAPLGQFQPNLCKEDSSLFKCRATPFAKGRYDSKNTLTTFKNLLIWSSTTGPISTELILAKATLGRGDSSLFKWRVIPFFKGDDNDF